MNLRHGIQLMCAFVALSAFPQTPAAPPKQVYTWERISFDCQDGGTAYVFTSVFPYCQVDTTPQDVVRAQMAKVRDAAVQACSSPTLDVMINGRDHSDPQSAEQDRAREMDGSSRSGTSAATAQITNDVYSTRCAPATPAP